MILTLFAAMIAGAPVQATTCVPLPAPGHSGARGETWFINSDPIKVGGKRYVKYGLPRVLQVGDVELLAPYKGGFVYAERGNPQREVLYLLTDLAGCEFQPYQVEAG